MKHPTILALSFAAGAAIILAGTARGQVADAPDSVVAGIPVNNTESHVKPYTLPDLLTLSNGQSVKDAATWMNERRPEIVHFYETQVYGRVPATAPKVTWELVSEDRAALDGAAVMKKLAGHMGGPNGPAINLTLYTPANATKPVPVIVGIQFGAFMAPPPLTANEAAKLDQAYRALLEAQDPAAKEILAKHPGYHLVTAPPAAAGGGGAPIARLLAAGIGYATYAKDDVETDIEGKNDPNVNIARKLGLAPGQTAPAADEWGAIAAWAWSLSRVEDYLETDKEVDAKRVAITGGSRLGKTVLWAGVNDPRIAMVIACSSGEGGAALARRNYGETIAHLVALSRYPYQFAANYQKYAADPSQMPMDTHLLVAAMAPRPLLLHTGANGDNWSDPKGEYLAAIAASPAYELLGKKGLARTADQPMATSEFVGGDLAFYLNNGGHASLNWDVAIKFMQDHLLPQN
ncbi:MAG TPA: acetylxylan esterase [Opitutales bacterium]|nr:acetylxylan esterase [Opitutales bacterium]